MTDALLQIADMLLVLAVAPALSGLVRWLKARLLGRRGPSPLQPYRDLARLLRKEAALADNASWVFRVAPYMSFTAIWLGASLIPTIGHGLPLGPTADLIALVALVGSARFFIALAGLDVGTSFGGIGASREMMIGSLAEPAMLMVTFTLAILVRSTSLEEVVTFTQTGAVGLRVSLALALIALIMVALA